MRVSVGGGDPIAENQDVMIFIGAIIGSVVVVFRDPIIGIAKIEIIGIRACATLDPVIRLATSQNVIATATHQTVGAVATTQRVIAILAIELVTSLAARQ